MNTKLTNIIDMYHPIAIHTVILDKDDKPISLIKSYNIDTKEAEVWRVKPNSWKSTNGVKSVSIQEDENGKPICDKVVLEGSKLRFYKTKNDKILFNKPIQTI